jgi:hypothetical protein
MNVYTHCANVIKRVCVFKRPLAVPGTVHVSCLSRNEVLDIHTCTEKCINKSICGHILIYRSHYPGVLCFMCIILKI